MGSLRTLTLPQGGRNREPLPGADPNAALRTLLRMPSISNVGELTTRGLDVATGADEFEPSEAELMQAQMSPQGAGFSREQLRDTAMSKVRALLGMQRIKQQNLLDIEKQKAATAAEKFVAQQEAMNARAEANRDAQMALLDQRLAAQEAAREDAQKHAVTMQDDRQSAAGAGGSFDIPATMVTSLDKARQSYGGTLNTLMRKVGAGGGRASYESGLVNVLTRMGTLRELQEAAQVAKAKGMNVAQLEQATGAQLHPYEREYLTLVLGD